MGTSAADTPAERSTPDPVRLTPEDGRLVTGVAVATVRARLTGEPEAAILRSVSESRMPAVAEIPADSPLRRPRACFVTLERQGKLRGCIGNLSPVQPLTLDVARNALRAMRDPRLPPVQAEEWPELDVTVSVLSPPSPIPATTREELRAALRPGVDGLVLTDGTRRSTFLPAVWRKITDPGEFVAALLVKGGWPREGWPAGMTAYRYTSDEFLDPAPRKPLSD